MSAIPLAAMPAVAVVPELGDAALRDAVRMLAHVRVQAHDGGGAAGRRRDDVGALGGDLDAAVAREVAGFAHAAQRRGVPITETLVAVGVAVRAAWGLMAIGPREAVVRDARRYCVKAYYEARAATPPDAESARR